MLEIEKESIANPKAMRIVDISITTHSLEYREIVNK
jgi:hypothetical protein